MPTKLVGTMHTEKAVNRLFLQRSEMPHWRSAAPQVDSQCSRLRVYCSDWEMIAKLTMPVGCCLYMQLYFLCTSATDCLAGKPRPCVWGQITGSQAVDLHA